MARWSVSNEGAYRSVGRDSESEDLTEWRNDDGATLAGGLLIFGVAAGVRCSVPLSFEA